MVFIIGLYLEKRTKKGEGTEWKTYLPEKVLFYWLQIRRLLSLRSRYTTSVWPRKRPCQPLTDFIGQPPVMFVRSPVQHFRSRKVPNKMRDPSTSGEVGHRPWRTLNGEATGDGCHCQWLVVLAPQSEWWGMTSRKRWRFDPQWTLAYTKTWNASDRVLFFFLNALY